MGLADYSGSDYIGCGEKGLGFGIRTLAARVEERWADLRKDKPERILGCENGAAVKRYELKIQI